MQALPAKMSLDRRLREAEPLRQLVPRREPGNERVRGGDPREVSIYLVQAGLRHETHQPTQSQPTTIPVVGFVPQPSLHVQYLLSFRRPSVILIPTTTRGLPDSLDARFPTLAGIHLMKNASPLSITLNGLAFLIFVAAMPRFGNANPLTEPIDFVRDIRPILQTHCYACHAASKQKSNLRLDIKSEAFKGGDNYGPSIIANNSSDSPLLQLVTSHDPDEQMPPEGERLSPAQIATLKQWIDEGANWPDGVDLAKLEDRRDHWSFKPIQKPQPPIVQDQTWPRSDLDRFILQSLEHVHLRPALEATRVAWLRRVSFDLIGLPPTPEQVDNFLNDHRQDAYEQVVDDLLRSPRYGERWAQHWLDVVRYADTHGFEVNTERPNAWPYRDYVIQAFNSDTPYDQFIRQQIAGDTLGQDAATGFLITASVLLPGQIGQDEPSKRLARQDSLDEIVVNIGQTFLGLSIGCARCHDHKFDPISAHEY